MSVTLCAIVKDEERYLPEWVAWHRALGFDEIVLIDNESAPACAEQIRRLEAAGIVKRLGWKTHGGLQNQHLAYLKALRGAATEWIAFLDIDELLVLHEDGDIGGFLARFGADVAIVHLCWRVFGSSGHQLYDPAPSFLRFPFASRRDHPINRHLKYVARVASIVEPFTHSAERKDGRSVNAAGEDVAVEAYSWGPIDHRVAQVNHYVTRSREEFAWKRERGRLSGATTGVPTMSDGEAESYFALHDLNDEPDIAALAMLDRYSRARAEIDAALAGPPPAPEPGPPIVGSVFAEGSIEVLQVLPNALDAPLVVTFSHWHPRGSSVPPFGRDMLLQRGFNAIHVVNQRSDWFLGRGSEATVEAMLGAVEALPVMQSAAIRIGYGSSMGGYAALRFRDRLNLRRAVVACPQFTIDAARAAFEHRWRDEAAECDFATDELRSVAPGEDIMLIYDPTLPSDCGQIELIDPHRRARHIAVPFSGHPPLTFFAQTGVVADLMTHLLQGSSGEAELRLAHQRRRQSALFWQMIAEGVLRRGKRLISARRAADRGLRLLPDDKGLLRLRETVTAALAASTDARSARKE